MNYKFDTETEQSLAKYKDYLAKNGFERIGYGATRVSFKRKNIVIKVPKSKCGFMDNEIEALAYKRYRNNESPDGMFLAPCRLIPNGCLMMKLVDDSNPLLRAALNSYASMKELLPKWVFGKDGYQIGMYKDRLVQYDYGHDARKERLEIHAKYKF